MMNRRLSTLVLALATVSAASVPALAAGSDTVKAKAVQSRASLKSQLADAKQQAKKAADDYKANLKSLQTAYEAELKRATEAVGSRKELYAQGIISKREYDASQTAISEAQAKIAGVKRQLAEVDETLAETEALGTMPDVVTPRSSGSAGVRLGSLGSGRWSLSQAGMVQSFFAGRFGRSLPVSAYGQSEVHNRLGYDHRNAMDVAVRPDSAEGQALIEFLRSRGIPFLAFRSAVPGVATGAHIHIGLPSHRI